jgi:hypothetical protein
MKSIFLLFFLCFTLSLAFSQEESKFDFKVQTDSRRTIINKNSVGIFGIRAGLLFKNKIETGVGIYSSSLFGILGKDVKKMYTDFSQNPPVTLPADVNFQYISIYGEYAIIDNKRLTLVTNNQFGVGRVNIHLDEGNDVSRRVRAGKRLIEHSLKAKVKTFPWLHLIVGVGYRYLINGEPQIKNTFNAPVYIIGASIDFKKLINSSKERKD